VPGCSDYEQVAQPTIENDFGGHTRIRTAQDHGERLLSVGNLMAAGKTGVGVRCLTKRESAIPLQESFQHVVHGQFRCLFYLL
jgi:hypothetical protein